MHSPVLSVRELEATDIDSIIRYWLEADAAFLEGMGVDLKKMPERSAWEEMLNAQLSQAYEDKKSWCLIWLIDGVPSGHSNVNKIVFGKEAYMHLHLWPFAARQKGMGTALVKLSLPWFFEKMKLEKLYCEPYALNPAPNKTLEKVGFERVDTRVTTPGWLNFQQTVHLWELTRDRYRQLLGVSPE